MKDKNLQIPINQDEISSYLKDIRKLKVMTVERERLLSENAKKSSFFDTKSVSQLTSSIALASALVPNTITPSAVTRAAALPALLPSLTRKISSALAISPAASVRAKPQSQSMRSMTHPCYLQYN